MNFDLSFSLDNMEFNHRVSMVAEVFNMSKAEVLKTALLTHISTLILPNYKHYKYILSGITQARMVKGVKGGNGIPSQLEILIDTYGLEEINNNILSSATDLVITSINSIFDRNNSKLKKAYSEAIQDPEFIFINLQLIVKIIGEKLLEHGIELKNKTLEIITEAIKKDKENMKALFVDAYYNGNPIAIGDAKIEYFSSINKYLNEYVSKLQIPYDKTIVFAKEQLILQKLGTEHIDILVGYLIGLTKEKVLEDNNIQRLLDFNYKI